MDGLYDDAGHGAGTGGVGSGGGATASAYGSGGATGRFQVTDFFKKPQVIVRLFAFVFSIVVFGCIQSQGYEKGTCMNDGPQGACGYGTFVGITAFLIAAVFLVLDGLFDNISNVMRRKYIVIADIVTACTWSFLYFVCFCYMTNSWRSHYDPEFFGKAGVEAAIAFSFFNIGIFIALTVLAVMRYRAGVSENLSSQPDFGYPSDQFADPRGGQLP